MKVLNFIFLIFAIGCTGKVNQSNIDGGDFTSDSATNTVVASPSPTPTHSASPTPNPTPSHSITPTPTPSVTPSHTPTPTATPTPSATPSLLVAPSPTPTPTPTPSPSPSSISTGENIYIAQTSLSNDSGLNCSNAHSVAWFNNSANWTNLISSSDGKIGPGDTVHLCGIVSTQLFFQRGGSSGNPVTLLFEPNAKISAPTWGDDQGMINAFSVSYVIIDGGANGVIEATNNGTLLGNQNSPVGVRIYQADHSEVKNLTIRTLYIRLSGQSDVQNGSTGISIDDVHNSSNPLSPFTSIHHNKISDAFAGIEWYVNVGGHDASIYNNVTTNTSVGIIFGSSSYDSPSFDGVNIFNNDISDEYNWDDPSDHYHNDGIHIWSYGKFISHLKIFGNYLHGNWGSHATTFIYMEGSVVTPLIYNNVLYCNGGNLPSDGLLYDRRTNNGGAADSSYTGSTAHFYDNTLVGCVADKGGHGIELQSPNPVSFTNNIITNMHVGIYLDGNQDLHSNNNIFYNIDQVVFGYNSLAQWQSSTGLDTSSLLSNPQLINDTSDFHLNSNSPARNHGANLSNFFSTDKDAVVRPPGSSAWDIGAYQFQ